MCYGYPKTRPFIQIINPCGPRDSYGPRALTASKIQIEDTSVLVSVLLLRKDNMTKATVIKERFKGWFKIQRFGLLSSWQKAWWQTGRHGAREEAKSHTSQSVGSRKRNSH